MKIPDAVTHRQINRQRPEDLSFANITINSHNAYTRQAVPKTRTCFEV